MFTVPACKGNIQHTFRAWGHHCHSEPERMVRWQNVVATVLETGTHFSDWHLCQPKEMCSNLPITCPS